jgi:hypothetical protein
VFSGAARWGCVDPVPLSLLNSGWHRQRAWQSLTAASFGRCPKIGCGHPAARDFAQDIATRYNASHCLPGYLKQYLSSHTARAGGSPRTRVKLSAAELLGSADQSEASASASASNMFIRQSSLIQHFRNGGTRGQSSGKRRASTQAIWCLVEAPADAKVSWTHRRGQA